MDGYLKWRGSTVVPMYFTFGWGEMRHFEPHVCGCAIHTSGRGEWGNT